MENTQKALQQKIGQLFNAGIECSLFFKKKHGDEAKYIFEKTLDLVTQLSEEQSHNPLLGDIEGLYDDGEMCELRIIFENKTMTVRIALFELQFDYMNLLLDNLMVRIADCKETRRLLIETLNEAKLFDYLTLDSDNNPDVVDNTICIFLELYRLSDKKSFRDIFISYLTELDEIPTFDEVYGLLKITPKQVIDFVFFFEYLNVSGKIEEFLKLVK